MKLEPGWVVREATLEDGTVDYFYCNPTLGIYIHEYYISQFI